MKKQTLLSIIVAAAFVGCNNNEVMDLQQQAAITFDNAFINNATRKAYDGSYTSGNLQEFQVYATITGADKNEGEGTANIFNGERVVRGSSLGCGTAWSYSSGNTQYWIPGNSYHFVAIADGNELGATEVINDATSNHMPSIICLRDAAAQKDILLAEYSVNNYTTPTGGMPAPVNFTFSHIMAKAKFTVKNTISTNNGYTYKVTNLKITNALKAANYHFNKLENILAYATWDEVWSPSYYELSFGDAVVNGMEKNDEATVADISSGGYAESNYDRLLIPREQTYNVTFDYQLLKDGIVIDTQKGKSITTPSLAFEAGHAYNLVINLGNPGEPITFNVEKVNTWDEDLNDNNTEDDDIAI